MLSQEHELPAVLTIPEVAELLRMSVKTFYRRSAARTLPVKPIDGLKNKYSRDAVLAYINGEAPKRGRRAA